MHISFMRTAGAAAVLAASTIAVTACGGAAPVPTIPPISTPAAGDPTPVGGSAAPGAVIVAVNIAFEPAVVTVPAGQPLTFTLRNQDQGVPHDLVIKDANGNELAKTEIITGPAEAQIGATLAAGAYAFVCTIHPNMTGTITAQ